MARSQAANLSGLLSDIGGTLGKMGEPGQQYVDTFRRQMAPDVDMNNSDSLLNYAEYARRNGYDDEAKQYMALGYQRKAVEQEKLYKTQVASGTEKLRGFNESVGTLESALSQAKAADPTGIEAANTELALNRVKDARRQHVISMNENGKASDFGVGNEGGTASRALVAETVAAEKAALQRDKTILELSKMRTELEDTLSNRLPIDLSMIPPNMRADYEARVAKAKNGVNPSIEIGNLNKLYGPASAKYLESLAKGDEATKLHLRKSVVNIRKVHGDDIGDWINENVSAVESALAEAESQLLGTQEYLRADSAKRQQLAEEALFTILRGQEQDFDEIVDEYRDDLLEDSAKDTQTSKIETRDRTLGYKPGFEQGGEQYKTFLAKAKASLGNGFSQAEFDESWDKKYWSPNGEMTPTSPTLKAMTMGPY